MIHKERTSYYHGVANGVRAQVASPTESHLSHHYISQKRQAYNRFGNRNNPTSTIDTSLTQPPIQDLPKPSSTTTSEGDASLSLDVVVANPQGIDQNFAVQLVKIAVKPEYISCDITYQYAGKTAYGRGFPSLLDLKAPKGAKVKITVSGNGTSQQCLAELVALIG